MRGCTLILLLFVLWGCAQPEDPRTPSTQDMATELAAIAEQAKQNNNYPYFTDQLLRKMELAVQGMPFTMRHGQWLDYVLVLMLKGNNEKCIETVDQFLAGNKYKKITDQNIQFYKVKALAWLRKGEITNCIKAHSGQSCIMPLKGTGIHGQKLPATEAIKVYEQLLAFDSLDIQSKWFLNLCYQAIGEYPDQVPVDWLIPETAFKSEVDFPVFSNISKETGVATNNHAGGASIEDFNNDGLLDIFTTSYSLGEQSMLYINDGQGNFVDETINYGIDGLVGGLNNIHADFNNDGLTDIYIMRGAWLAGNGRIPNSLLINQGSRFSDETKSSGLYAKSPTGAIAVADFNLDGHLDLFVGNESSGRNAIFPCQLFMNNGDGTFTDVAGELGLEVNQFVKGATWGDVNNDMWPDLYLSLYHGRNKLFINRGGNEVSDWVFEEVSQKAGVHEPVMSFPTWFWDYDQDGWQDLLVIGYDNRESYLIAGEVAKDYMGLKFKGETPRLYRNNGDETFTDVTEQAGLDKLLYAMGGNFGDLNNDGYPDFYLGTGEFNIWASVPNRAFVNVDGKRFADVTSAGEFGQIQKGHGVAFGDLDNDGDQDIYHQVGGAAESDVFQNMLFQNPGFNNHWLTLELEGKSANRSAIGAKIELTVAVSDTLRNIYHVVGTGGSFGTNSLRAEIGLGNADGIQEIKVHWPDRSHYVQSFNSIEMDKAYYITQGDSLLRLLSYKSISLNSDTHHAHH